MSISSPRNTVTKCLVQIFEIFMSFRKRSRTHQNTFSTMSPSITSSKILFGFPNVSSSILDFQARYINYLTMPITIAGLNARRQASSPIVHSVRGEVK